MTTKRLIDLIEHPEKMDANSLRELGELIKMYPYFQTARALYLLNLSQLRSLKLPAELKKNVIYCTDRRKLFMMLDNNEFEWSTLMKEVELRPEPERKRMPDFTLVEDFLQTTNDESLPKDIEDLIPHKPAPVGDYVSQLLGHPDVEQEVSDIGKKQETIIDSFIESDRIRPSMTIQTDNQSAVKVEKDEALVKDEAFLTESLAKIYIKQKKYVKALEIIKKLSLKYPEKNVYFADQIRFLEKIISNIKTD